MQSDVETCDVAIVGGGWYGLIAAHTYRQLAPQSKVVLLDDGATIGGVWSKERIYPNLFAQVGHGLFEYSFYPMSKEGLTKDRYISGETIHRYLNNFARDYGLLPLIRLNTRVARIERADGGEAKWRLSLRTRGASYRTGDYQLEAAKVIQASGVTSEKYVPDFPRERFSKPIIHSGELGVMANDLGAEETKRIVVLGAAKSAYDTVFHLLKEGKKVDWVIREDGTGPLAISPPTQIFGLFNSVDLLGTRMVAAMSPAILNTKGFWYWFLQRSNMGRALTHRFWRYLTQTCEVAAGYDDSETMKKLEPVPFKYGIFWANSGLGLASVPNFWKTLHEGDLQVHRTSITSFVDDQVVLKDGQRLPTDFVILCTGWKHNLSVYDDQLQSTLGLPSKAGEDASWTTYDKRANSKVDELLPNLQSIPHETYENPANRETRPWRLYRRLVSPQLADKADRSIVFLGQIHSVYTPLVSEMQSLWSCAYLLGELPTPSVEGMREEISLWNAWTAKRYLAQGRKHAYSIYDFLAYVDTLARDLGVRVNRKSNPISEMLATYRPRDYRGLIDEYRAVRAKRQATAAAQSSQVEKTTKAASVAGTTEARSYALVSLLQDHFQKLKPVYTLLLGFVVLVIALML
ncbi:uncharacterized protein HMPREF1541_09831 [Cyphellophora europaea CBS 101466]|uniref:L-ornithine N(5)-oxygenase n=1 Tax=Cyphellophora europaea (strain CBS 101466) TaxID=1220924 RepID=W2S8C5_CYPE1|nr:uncharacterized protein HMPREF1541_09831 [Cyphellophora europaea CBS 101466]ETN44956.1 hypothetical protein HMPREF1541_09831 [Cyphellophora europaea CBS 101466]